MTPKEEKCLSSQKPVLFIAPNLRVLSLMREAIFNRFGLECFGINYDSTDTGFSYQVLSSISVNSELRAAIGFFCEGFLEAIQLLGGIK